MRKSDLIRLLNFFATDDEIRITDGKTLFDITLLQRKEPEPIEQSSREEFFEEPIKYTEPYILIKYRKPYKGKNPF